MNERLESIIRWCRGDARVKALLLVGSYARGEQRPDSDMDLVLVTDDKESLLTLEWTKIYGKEKSVVREEYGACTSIRVHYMDGMEMEYGIVDVSWLSCPLDQGTRRVLEDGYQLLYGADGIDQEKIVSLLA